MKKHMKSLKFCLFLLLFSTNYLFGQNIKFIGLKTIAYHPEYQEWDDWPDEWYNLSDEESFSMYISEEVVGKIYKVVLYKNKVKFNEAVVRYDSQKSVEVRDAWDNQYINCYKDSDGDYIYTANVSLEQLSKNSDPWTDSESVIYFWLFSANTGIALR